MVSQQPLIGLGSQCDWTAECQVSVTESVCHDRICICNFGFSPNGALCEYTKLPAWVVLILIAVLVTVACITGMFTIRFVRRKLKETGNKETTSTNHLATSANDFQPIDGPSLGEIEEEQIQGPESEDSIREEDMVENIAGNRKKSVVFYDNIAVIEEV